MLDTETTGLLKNHIKPLNELPEIIEFYGAIVDLKTGKISSELDTLVKPTRPIPDEPRKITGITDETVAEAPTFLSILPQVDDLFEQAGMLIAHNLSYDMEIISIEYERLGKEPKWPMVKICTVEQTVHLKGYRLSLTALHELLFGETFSEAHRAGPDTKALIRCAVAMNEKGWL